MFKVVCIDLQIADGTAIEELRRLRVSISDFEVKGVIGRGHFGEVQVVHERDTNIVYALKILRKADTFSQQSVRLLFTIADIVKQNRNLSG